MKKAIVTGGLGFIGSHLCEMLLAKDVEIIVIDNGLNNTIDVDFFKSDKCTVINKSIQETDLSKVGEVDIVFHLASILGPSGVLKHAGDIGHTVIDDTVKLRNYCIEKEILLVDVSTSEIYGHTGSLEETSHKVFKGVYEVRTEYGAAKMVAEMALTNKSKREPRLKYQIIRPFNISGQRQKPDGGFVLPRFVVGALTDQPITVFGDGTQRRAFTHVKDICEAILQISESKFVNEIWNIGNPLNEMSIKELADLVVEVVKEKFSDKNPEIVFVDPKTIHGSDFAEALDKVPYVEKVNSKIGWKAKRPAKQIVEDVVDYYSEKIQKGYSFKVM